MIRQLTERARKLGAEALRLIGSYWLFAGIAIFYLVVFQDSPFKDKSLLATTVFSTGTLVFAFLAYQFSRERFRLDLFDKRFEIYEATLAFCSEVTAQGSLRAATPEQRPGVERAIRAAEGSFRGIGYHKARALFGEDIRDLFKRLNDSYSWLSVYGEGRGGLAQGQWADQHYTHTMFIWDTVSKLPDLFRGYMYFGDYRRG